MNKETDKEKVGTEKVTKEGKHDRKNSAEKKKRASRMKSKSAHRKSVARVSFPEKEGDSPPEPEPKHSPVPSKKPSPSHSVAAAVSIHDAKPVPVSPAQIMKIESDSEHEDFDKESVLFEPSVGGVTEEDFNHYVPPAYPGQFYNEVGRAQWANNMDFLLSLIGFAVDVANVWGFPYFCLIHGGASFMIPYTIMLIFCVIPVMYMELLIGQFVSQGFISVWKLCPLFKGVGWCIALVSFFVSFYYNVTLAWALVYLYESISFSEIRWVTCGNSWNTKDNCLTILDDQRDLESEGNNETQKIDASKEFLNRRILKVRDDDEEFDLENIGSPDTDLAIALLFVYIILFICVLFGIKVTGKVVWVTATVPYIVMGLLLFRGITLPGSSSGLLQFIQPKFGSLLGIDIWRDAALQVFFSAGAGFGVHLTYASFNSFKHNLLRDCIVTMMVNSGTSVLAGMVIFSYLGNVAYSTRKNVTEITSHGIELIFEAFPSAVGRLPGAHFFSCVFFFMVFLLGIDSSLGAISAITTSIGDEFHDWFVYHPRLRPTFIFAAVSLSYLIALACVTRGGIYLYIILDATAASVSLMTAVFLQTVAIAYVYGLKDLNDAAEAMTGSRPGIFFNICWKFVTPLTLILLIFSGVHQAIVFTPIYGEKEVPVWGYIIGLLFAFTPILMFPIIAIHNIISIPEVSLKMKFKLAITPDHEYDEVLKTGKSRRTTLKHLMYFEIPKNLFNFKRKGRVAPGNEPAAAEIVSDTEGAPIRLSLRKSSSKTKTDEHRASIKNPNSKTESA